MQHVSSVIEAHLLDLADHTCIPELFGSQVVMVLPGSLELFEPL